MYMLLTALGVLGLLRWPVVIAAVALIGGLAFALDVLGVAHLMGVDRARFIFFFFTGSGLLAARSHHDAVGPRVRLHCRVPRGGVADLEPCCAPAGPRGCAAVRRTLARVRPRWGDSRLQPGRRLLLRHVHTRRAGADGAGAPVRAVAAARELPRALLIVLPRQRCGILEARALARPLPSLLARLPRWRVKMAQP